MTSDDLANAERAITDDPGQALLLAESLSLGFMAVLERASPMEQTMTNLHVDEYQLV